MASILPCQDVKLQGHPYGQLAFSPMAFQLSNPLESDLSLWCADDLSGVLDTVLADLRRVLDAQQVCGLKLGPAKCMASVFIGN